MSISIQQLKKIQLLAKNNPEFQFVDSQMMTDIENQLAHGATSNLGEEAYKNIKTYSNEYLHGVLDEQVKLIGQIQRLCIQNKQAICNMELETINLHKEYHN